MFVAVRASIALKRMLDGMERHGPFILTRQPSQRKSKKPSTVRRPWFTEKDDKALSKAWSEHARSVGIPELVFHDLRGTAVTLLGEAGCTLPEIVLITGHTLQSAARILERYMKRTKAMAEAAIIRFENASATQSANRLQTTNTTPKRAGGNHE